MKTDQCSKAWVIVNFRPSLIIGYMFVYARELAIIFPGFSQCSIKVTGFEDHSPLF